jgi:hypothetical protein
MTQVTRAILCPEETDPASGLNRDVPLNSDSVGIEVNPTGAATSEPHLITHRAVSSNAWAGEILSSTNSREKEAWQDGKINYLPCA